MTFDRRRSELRLAACAVSIYLVSIMKTKLQNLTHTTADSRCLSRRNNVKAELTQINFRRTLARVRENKTGSAMFVMGNKLGHLA